MPSSLPHSQAAISASGPANGHASEGGVDSKATSALLLQWGAVAPEENPDA